MRRPRGALEEPAFRREWSNEKPGRVEDREARRPAVGDDLPAARRPSLRGVLAREDPPALSGRPDDSEGGLDIGQCVEEEQARWTRDGRTRRGRDRDHGSEQCGDRSDAHTQSMGAGYEGAARDS